MKVMIAMDSFKGSLSSLEAAQAVKQGILRADSNIQVQMSPLADGGEGTMEALTAGLGGQFRHVKVTGPLGTPVEATYGIIKHQKLAVMEMASAAGITLIEARERNPLKTTTYGVGEMIKDALDQGCDQFLIGIGGSATNDGGAGMLQALGYQLLDSDSKQIKPGAEGLRDLVRIVDTDADPRLWGCEFRIACDVTNPLCGENGCSYVFGPQKGADVAMIQDMDQWMQRYAELAGQVVEHADAKSPGVGAAGGLGFAFRSFLNGRLEPGIQIVLEVTGLEEKLKDADVVITGEGRLDGQSVMGKAPVGVAALAKKHHKKVIAFSGSVTRDARVCNEHGIDAFFPVLRSVTSLEEAMKPEMAKENLADTAEQVFRLLCLQSGEDSLAQTYIEEPDFSREQELFTQMNRGFLGNPFTCMEEKHEDEKYEDEEYDESDELLDPLQRLEAELLRQVNRIEG